MTIDPASDTELDDDIDIDDTEDDTDGTEDDDDEAVAPLLPGLTDKDTLRLARVLASIKEAEARTAAANAKAAEAETAIATQLAAAQLQIAEFQAAAPAELLPICRHVMSSGRRCHAIRHNRTSYCYFHDKHRDRVRKRYDSSYNLAHLPLLEDRASIQVALDETLRGFINGSINDRKAGLLLYGIQIAFQNVRSLDKDMISADSLSSTVDDEHDDLPLVPFTDEEMAAHNAESAVGQQDRWDAAVAAIRKNLPPDPQLNLWPEDPNQPRAAPSPLLAHPSAQVQ
jgi:hypothetical protein